MCISGKLGEGRGGKSLGQWNYEGSTSKSPCHGNKPTMTYLHKTLPVIKIVIVCFDLESKIQKLKMAVYLFTGSIIV